MKGFKQGKDPKKPETKQSPPDTHSLEKALTAYRNGKLEESKELLYIVLSKPETASNETFHGFALGFMATLERAQGNKSKALELFKASTELSLGHADILHNYSSLLAETSPQAALSISARAVNLAPENAAYLERHGFIRWKCGDLQGSAKALRKAIELNPALIDAHINLGIVLREQGHLDQALAATLKAIELKPDHADAHINLGGILKEKGQFDKALAATLKAIRLKPDHADAHMHLGGILQAKCQLDQALAAARKAIELKPDHADAYIVLGNIHRERDQINEAINAVQQAIDLRPDYHEAHRNISYLYLSKGDYTRGWEEFEWRLENRRFTMTHARPTCKQWDGRELDTDAKLMIVSEQGLGDTLQFMRYCHTLREKGLNISLCAQTKLHGLIQTSGIDPSPLTPKQGNSAISDFWIPLLSVPHYLGVSPNNPISQKPYIKTSESLIGKWKKILEAEKNPIIGIHWQGNPEAEKTTLRGRSLPLEAFKPVAAQKSLSLLSLQKGFGSEQLENCSFKERFVSCQHEVDQAWDFLETAAVIACCDLIITNDTGLAHLAGGLGKTTWLLLHAVPDWRWGLEGDKSFWYPTMRLFRQRKRDTWNEVMDYVANELAKEFPNSASVKTSK